MKITGKKLTDEELDKVAGGCGYPGYDNDNAMDDRMDSPAHRDNIPHNELEKTALAFYKDDDGKYYWAQEFGY